MKARRWTIRVAVFGALLVGGGAIAAAPAFATGLPTTTSAERDAESVGGVQHRDVDGDGERRAVAGFASRPRRARRQRGSDRDDPADALRYDFDPVPIFGTHAHPDESHLGHADGRRCPKGTHLITANYFGGDRSPSVGRPLSERHRRDVVDLTLVVGESRRCTGSRCRSTPTCRAPAPAPSQARCSCRPTAQTSAGRSRSNASGHASRHRFQPCGRRASDDRDVHEHEPGRAREHDLTRRAARLSSAACRSSHPPTPARASLRPPTPPSSALP